MSTSITILHHKEAENTFNLPDGEDIRVALVAWNEVQRAGVIDQVKAGGGLETKDIPDVVLPDPDGAELASALEPILDLIWDESAGAFGAATGLDPAAFTHDTPAAAASIAEQIAEVVASVVSTLGAALRAVAARVRDLVTGGTITPEEAPDEAVREYDVIFDEMPDWRANMIAVTEASRTHHELQLMMGRESGQVTGWRWRCNSGACPICLEIEADCPVVQDGEAFAVIGVDTLYSTIYAPPAHPNCLCDLEPVLIDDIQPDTWGVTLIQPTGKSMPLPRSWRRPPLKSAAPPRPAARVRFRSWPDASASS